MEFCSLIDIHNYTVEFVTKNNNV